MPRFSSTSWFGVLTRPRQLRFSVRTLVIVLTLLALVLGLYIVPAQRAQVAADTLQESGCELHWSYQMIGGKWDPQATSGVRPELLSLLGPAYFHRAVELRCPQLDAMHSKPAAEALVRYLPALRQLNSVELAPGVATDDVLAAIAKLPGLQSLTISGPEISDKGLAHIGRLTLLRSLSIRSPQLTDWGIAHLKALSSLRSLQVNTTSA